MAAATAQRLSPAPHSGYNKFARFDTGRKAPPDAQKRHGHHRCLYRRPAGGSAPRAGKDAQVIGKAIPDADETISYGMPAYALGGRVVVYFAGWKQHAALYPGSAQTFAAFGKDVAGYATSKGTLQFPLGEPLPVRLIAAIAKYRAKEVAEIKGCAQCGRRRSA